MMLERGPGHKETLDLASPRLPLTPSWQLSIANQQGDRDKQ